MGAGEARGWTQAFKAVLANQRQKRTYSLEIAGKRACSNESTGVGKGVAGECDAGRLAADRGDVCRNQEHGGGGLGGKQAERCFARRADQTLEGRSENVARRKEFHPGDKGSGISGHARGRPKTVWRRARRSQGPARETERSPAYREDCGE